MGKVLVCALSALALVSAAPQVHVGSTTFLGRDVASSTQEFFGGIPFAEPPLGNLRLRPPVLKLSLSTSIFDASSFGPSCLQISTPGPLDDSLSEDCLTINILRPAEKIAPKTLLPVMVWVYGGGFYEGGSSIYNGSGIVRQSVERGTPVIYVSFNYRVGPLGFPQGQEADDRKALNLGLKDQLTALQWIQHNIAAFGGDKKKVTVFGESAGAISIAVLFLNSNLQKLARAAILQSGSAASATPNRAAAHQIDWSNFVAAVPECASLANTSSTFTCLRTANSSALLRAFVLATGAASEQIPWPPTLDGDGGVFPDLPSRLFAQGHFTRLPFIAGTNLDEGTAFTPQTINYTTQIIRSTIIADLSPPFVGTRTLDAAVDRILELYPDDLALGSPIGTGNETFGLSSQYKRLAIISNDLPFQSQRRLWSETASNARVPTWGYLFTDPQPQLPPALGVTHGSDIGYIYSGMATNPRPSAANLSIRMIDYWLSFATSLDPNDKRGSKRPMWPQYTPRNQVLMQLNGENTTVLPDNYREEQIAFFIANPVVFHHRRFI